MIIVFDLDGTLANIKHRRHLVSNGNNKWDEFYKQCVNDDINAPVVEIYKTLQKSGKYKMIIFSGRSEIVRKETEEWLEKNYIKYDELRMRPKDNYIPDEILKLGWLMEIKEKGMMLAIFDDRAKVVKMWRGQGYCCFQVAEGNF